MRTGEISGRPVLNISFYKSCGRPFLNILFYKIRGSPVLDLLYYKILNLGRLTAARARDAHCARLARPITSSAAARS